MRGASSVTSPIILPLLPSDSIPLWLGVLRGEHADGIPDLPFGTMPFMMKGIAPKGISMGDIYRSVVPS